MSDTGTLFIKRSNGLATSNNGTGAQATAQLAPPALSIERRQTFDDRVYGITTPDGAQVFYPSVTSILGDVKVGYGLDGWKAEQASSFGVEGARLDMWWRAERGKAVHAAIEKYLKGESLSWFNLDGRPNYDDKEWRAICRFEQWFTLIQPKVLATEMTVFSHIYRYAGTCDAILEIDGQIVVVDFKTSAQIFREHELQVVAYADAVAQMFPAMVAGHRPAAAVLVLNSSHRTTKQNPDGSCNGPGWCFKPVKDAGAAMVHFLNRLDVFRDAHGEIEPKTDLLPERVVPTHAIGGGLD